MSGAPSIGQKLARSIREVAAQVDAFIVLDQTDVPQTGVVTSEVLRALGSLSRNNPNRLILAYSRQGLRNFPAVGFKLNAARHLI